MIEAKEAAKGAGGSRAKRQCHTKYNTWYVKVSAIDIPESIGDYPANVIVVEIKGDKILKVRDLRGYGAREATGDCGCCI